MRPASIFQDTPLELPAEVGKLSATTHMPALARITLSAAALAIVLAGALAAASYWSGGAPSTFAILPIAEPYAVRAEALINKPHPSREDLGAAEAATRQELVIAPRRVDAHLRLAIIEVLRDGGLTVAALNELKRSYDFSPLDPDYFAPRIRFALEHWGELDDSARTRVSKEIAVTSTHRPGAKLRDLVNSVTNPQGRFGGLMSLNLTPG